MSQIIVTSTEELERIVQQAVQKALASARQAPAPDEWVSVTEFCKRTGRNPETARNSVYQKCANGDYPAEKDGKRGKAWRINWTAYCRAGNEKKEIR